jgi:hypothetical protein
MRAPAVPDRPCDGIGIGMLFSASVNLHLRQFSVLPLLCGSAPLRFIPEPCIGDGGTPIALASAASPALRLTLSRWPTYSNAGSMVSDPSAHVTRYASARLLSNPAEQWAIAPGGNRSVKTKCDGTSRKRSSSGSAQLWPNTSIGSSPVTYRAAFRQ